MELIERRRAIRAITACDGKSAQIEALEKMPAVKKIEPKGMYQCFHCLDQAVSWDSDFDFSDFGYEGEGVVHICHCNTCGAEIEYRCASGREEEDEI